jgi:hypothetical protein
MMKSKLIMSVLIIVSIALSAFLIESAVEKRADQKRHAEYQSLLSEYSAALDPGTLRSQVEAILASRGRSFQQTCCLLNENRNAFEDLVKIGSEPKPWYCSENDMYLVFEFDSVRDDPQFPNARPDDRSRRIALSPWLGGCL